MNTNLLSPTRLLFAISISLTTPASATEAPVEVQVWKSPTCGCCKKWVEHMQADGFKVTSHDIGNSGARRRFGIDQKYGACHTARIGDYVIEGHVPASDVRRLLKSSRDASVIGIAVPGMPIGSPGMDGPAYNGRSDPYNVLLLKRDASSSVFQSHP